MGSGGTAWVRTRAYPIFQHVFCHVVQWRIQAGAQQARVPLKNLTDNAFLTRSQ